MITFHSYCIHNHHQYHALSYLHIHKRLKSRLVSWSSTCNQIKIWYEILSGHSSQNIFYFIKTVNYGAKFCFTIQSTAEGLNELIYWHIFKGRVINEFFDICFATTTYIYTCIITWTNCFRRNLSNKPTYLTSSC